MSAAARCSFCGRAAAPPARQGPCRCRCRRARASPHHVARCSRSRCNSPRRTGHQASVGSALRNGLTAAGRPQPLGHEGWQPEPRNRARLVGSHGSQASDSAPWGHAAGRRVGERRVPPDQWMRPGALCVVSQTGSVRDRQTQALTWGGVVQYGAVTSCWFQLLRGCRDRSGRLAERCRYPDL